MRFFIVKGVIITWNFSSMSKYFLNLRLVFKVFIIYSFNQSSILFYKLLNALASARILCLFKTEHRCSIRQVSFYNTTTTTSSTMLSFPTTSIFVFLSLSEARDMQIWASAISADEISQFVCQVPDPTLFKLIFPFPFLHIYLCFYFSNSRRIQSFNPGCILGNSLINKSIKDWK